MHEEVEQNDVKDDRWDKHNSYDYKVAQHPLKDWSDHCEIGTSAQRSLRFASLRCSERAVACASKPGVR